MYRQKTAFSQLVIAKIIEIHLQKATVFHKFTIINYFKVLASDDATTYIEETGRSLFPVGTTSDKKADFRLPIAEIIPEELLDESRVPRLINGPPPTENEDDLAIVIVGSANTESDSEEGRSLPLDNGR